MIIADNSLSLSICLCFVYSSSTDGCLSYLNVHHSLSNCLSSCLSFCLSPIYCYPSLHLLLSCTGVSKRTKTREDNYNIIPDIMPYYLNLNYLHNTIEMIIQMCRDSSYGQQLKTTHFSLTEQQYVNNGL